MKNKNLIHICPSTYILRDAGKFSGIRHSKIRMLEKKEKIFIPAKVCNKHNIQKAGK